MDHLGREDVPQKLLIFQCSHKLSTIPGLLGCNLEATAISAQLQGIGAVLKMVIASIAQLHGPEVKSTQKMVAATRTQLHVPQMLRGWNGFLVFCNWKFRALKRPVGSHGMTIGALQ